MGDRRTLKEQPWYVRINLYAIVFAILFFAVVAYGTTVDFEPFKFYGWRNVPQEVCPLDPFDSAYVSEVRAGPYSIGSLDGAATMLDENDKVVDSWEIEPIPLEPYPKTYSPSVAVRSAPVTPGFYKFGLDAKVSGRMFYFIPTYQHVNEEARQMIEVLPLNSRECKEILFKEG